VKKGTGTAGTLLLALLCLAQASRAGEPVREQGAVATLPPVGAHWVWVPDLVFAHSLLFDGDSGEVLATIDGGTTISPKPPLFSPERGEFYSVEIDYARGKRGKRTDFVTIHDARTLDVTGEIVLPTRTSESAASLGYAELLDGGPFLATFNQFPVTSVSITNLRARTFVGEIPVTGCAGVYPTGERSFATLCGDGTMLSVTLDADGRRLATESTIRFFDVVDDAVMMSGGRVGRRWVFASFGGIAHEIDFAASPPAVTSWSMVDESERALGWRPGGRQLLALHGASQRLYVLFHRGEAGSHKDPGPEVWVFDLASRTRVDRIAMPNFAAAFIGDMLEVEEDGFGAWLLRAVLPDAGADTIAVTQDEAPLLFARSSEIGSVAVLDARTGEHLRSLTEVGLAGMRLAVP
jgi:methylamine dehydrogenase heavy chain